MSYITYFALKYYDSVVEDIEKNIPIDKAIFNRKSYIETIYKEMQEQISLNQENCDLFMKDLIETFPLKEEERTDENLFIYAIRAAMRVFKNGMEENTPGIIFQGRFAPLIDYAYKKYLIIKEKENG